MVVVEGRQTCHMPVYQSRPQLVLRLFLQDRKLYLFSLRFGSTGLFLVELTVMVSFDDDPSVEDLAGEAVDSKLLFERLI